MLYFQNNMFSQKYLLFLGQAGHNYRLFDTGTFEGFRKRKKKEEKASQIDFTYVMFCTIRYHLYKFLKSEKRPWRSVTFN